MRSIDQSGQRDNGSEQAARVAADAARSADGPSVAARVRPAAENSAGIGAAGAAGAANGRGGEGSADAGARADSNMTAGADAADGAANTECGTAPGTEVDSVAVDSQIVGPDPADGDEGDVYGSLGAGRTAGDAGIDSADVAVSADADASTADAVGVVAGADDGSEVDDVGSVATDPFVGLDGDLVEQLRAVLAGDLDLAGVRTLAAAAAFAAGRVGEVSYQAARKDLASLVGDFGQLAAMATAGQIVLTAEADRDGVVTESTCRSTAAWVRDADWHLTAGAATQIAKCARILQRPDLTQVADAIRTADLPASTAVTIESEFDKITADLATDIDELPESIRDHVLTDFGGDVHRTVLAQMIDIGADHGSQMVTRYRESFLAQYGTAGAFQQEQDSKKRYIDLTGARRRAGVFEYTLTVDAEGHAVIEAAINTLAAPHPHAGDGGVAESDTRSVGRRRGDALIEVCRRAVASGELPATHKTSLYLTMSIQDYQALTGSATVTGTIASGSLLGPEAARRLTCDGCIIPVLTTDQGDFIDVADEIRLYTRKLTRAVWQRDQHCTYPGCDAPATWCDVHHLIHYIDSGSTTISNAALLCGRHHTIVHRDRIAGRVVGGRVEWDTQPGSYDRMLATAGPDAQRELRARRRRKHNQRQADNGTSQT